MLFLLNFFVLQWFTVRLAMVYRDGKLERFTLLTRIVPMSGWRSSYRYF